MDSNTERRTMRAARLHGIRDLRIEELPLPVPGPGEVLLRVASVGVCGSDVHFYLEGSIGDQVIAEPLVPGHEFSGWVEAHGPGANQPEIGQLVAVEPATHCGHCESCEHGHPNLCPEVRFKDFCGVDGARAEHVDVPAANCHPMPAGFSQDDGVLLETRGVAIHSADQGHLTPSCTIAVLGAGSIGLLIAAVAKASGAAEFYMTEPLEYRRDLALSYAADDAFDPNAGDVVQGILQSTGGRGVDVAFEAAGAPDTPAQAAEIARPGGTVVVAGIPSDDTMCMKAGTVRRKGLTIRLVRRMKHTYPRAIRMVRTGTVDLEPLVTHRFPIRRIVEAYDTVADHADGVLKAVVRL
jgi:L-iditol 2-dehydrogenase